MNLAALFIARDNYVQYWNRMDELIALHNILDCIILLLGRVDFKSVAYDLRGGVSVEAVCLNYVL